MKTVPAEREITILDLLTHRSGLTYAFLSQGPILDLYREARLDEAPTNEDLVHRIATLPLVHQPGTAFQYSRSTDVLGRLVEIVSGESLDRFLCERILGPLGMKDTSFYLSEEKAARLVTLYERVDGGGLRPVETFRDSPKVKGPKTLFEGGGGLVGDVSDYDRFLQMLLNGGELDGVRLVSPKTIELMTTDSRGAGDRDRIPATDSASVSPCGKHSDEGTSSAPKASTPGAESTTPSSGWTPKRSSSSSS